MGFDPQTVQPVASHYANHALQAVKEQAEKNKKEKKEERTKGEKLLTPNMRSQL